MLLDPAIERRWFDQKELAARHDPDERLHVALEVRDAHAQRRCGLRPGEQPPRIASIGRSRERLGTPSAPLAAPCQRGRWDLPTTGRSRCTAGGWPAVGRVWAAVNQRGWHRVHRNEPGSHIRMVEARLIGTTSSGIGSERRSHRTGWPKPRSSRRDEVAGSRHVLAPARRRAPCPPSLRWPRQEGAWSSGRSQRSGSRGRTTYDIRSADRSTADSRTPARGGLSGPQGSGDKLRNLSFAATMSQNHSFSVGFESR